MRWVPVVLLLSATACSDASLSELRPGLQSNVFQCRMALDLKRYPKGDPSDIRVTFSSVVLFKDETYDWQYMADNDFLLEEQLDSLGNEITRYVPDESTTPEDIPKLGTMRVQFRIPSQEQVQLKAGDNLTITATLYWAGKKQDSITRGLLMAYQTR